MFRVSRADIIKDADTIDGAWAIVRPKKPGRYHVDEIRADPFTSGHTSRAWGSLIRHDAGRVADKPHPWPDS
jgi:hypothetical protein